MTASEGRGAHFEREIAEQPRVVEGLLADGRAAAERIAAGIRARGPRALLMAARGSSDNAARYAQYLFAAHNHLLVALATPSLYTVYQAPPSLAEVVTLGISQSGRSPDIVAVLAEARRQGGLAIAITNEPESPLAGEADHCLSLGAGQEQAVAASKTYTAELAALAMISAALEGDEARWRQLEAVPAAIRETLRLGAAAAGEAATAFVEAQRFAVLGRGFNYGTAFEVALKIEETSYVLAEPYSSADFRHGPAAVVEQGFPVVAVAPSGLVKDDLGDAIAWCRGRGASVAVISDDPRLLELGTVGLELPTGVPEWLSPLVSVVAGQLFALECARARGLDPDRPRSLSKITETR